MGINKEKKVTDFVVLLPPRDSQDPTPTPKSDQQKVPKDQ